MFKLIGDPLYQWNKWRKIEITDSKVAFVDYALESETVGTRVEVKSVDGVLVADIPNDKLWNARRIKMWFVDAEKNAFASDVLVVLPKAQDPDYVYEPTEILSYENLEARIEALEKNGGGSASEVRKEEIFYIEIASNGTANKTYDDIAQAYNKGKYIVLKDVSENEIYTLNKIGSSNIGFSYTQGNTIKNIALIKSLNKWVKTTIDLNLFQKSEENSLKTTDKTVVGAINELSEDIADLTSRMDAIIDGNEVAY